MIIGAPKEIKDNEYRVGITPGGVRQIVQAGHLAKGVNIYKEKITYHAVAEAFGMEVEKLD